MHELSYIIDIVNTVIETATKNNYKKVNKIVVEVGEMSGVVPYYLHKYFPEAIKDTMLEKAELEVISKEVKIKCDKCREIYHPSKESGYKCPVCGERKGDLLQGKGIQIKELEIEE